MGAWLATWGALTFVDLPPLVLLPLMVVLGFVGGGLWAAVAGVLRAKGWVNETISTLLMNYVARQLVAGAGKETDQMDREDHGPGDQQPISPVEPEDCVSPGAIDKVDSDSHNVDEQEESDMAHKGLERLIPPVVGRSVIANHEYLPRSAVFIVGLGQVAPQGPKAP